MGWEFRNLQSADVTDVPTAIAFDGRNVWVASATVIKVYGFWDANSQNEYIDQNFQFDKEVRPLYEIKSITVVNPVTALAYWNGKMYAKTATSILSWSGLDSNNIVASTSYPVFGNNYDQMCAANNKLFYTSIDVDSDERNVLKIVNLGTGVTTQIAIPGRKQVDIGRSIIDSLNGTVLITAFNENGIYEFDHVNNQFLTFNIVNRHPYLMEVGQDKMVYIASDKQVDEPLGGMISRYDQVGSVLSAFCAAGGCMNSLGSDYTRGEIWYVGDSANLARLDTATSDFRIIGGNPDEFGVSSGPGTEITFDTWHYSAQPNSDSIAIVTPPITIETWNGSSMSTRVIKPYLFYSVGNNIFGARLGAMTRINILDVLGTGMISYGPQQYFGT